MLINNAGVFEANPIDQDDADWVADWERTMRINLTACAELCRLAVRHWQERGDPAAASSTSPAAPPIAATSPRTGIMPRPRRGWWR